MHSVNPHTLLLHTQRLGLVESIQRHMLTTWQWIVNSADYKAHMATKASAHGPRVQPCCQAAATPSVRAKENQGKRKSSKLDLGHHVVEHGPYLVQTGRCCARRKYGMSCVHFP